MPAAAELSHGAKERDRERECPLLEIDTQSGENDQLSHTLLSLGSATTAGSSITSVGILFKPTRPLNGAIFKRADPSRGRIYTEVHSEAFGLRVCKSQARMAEGAGFMAGRTLAFGDGAASVIYKAILQSESELIWRGREKKKKDLSPAALK